MPQREPLERPYRPAPWCAVHEDRKWCEHNGGRLDKSTGRRIYVAPPEDGGFPIWGYVLIFLVFGLLITVAGVDMSEYNEMCPPHSWQCL